MNLRRISREQILEEAIAISEERGETHGPFDLMAETSDALISAYLKGMDSSDKVFGPFDGTGRDTCIVMALIKIARIACGSDAYEHYLDAANYMAQAGHLVCNAPETGDNTAYPRTEANVEDKQDNKQSPSERVDEAVAALSDPHIRDAKAQKGQAGGIE